ncbi:MAG TPA: SpoIID/LytB domain-containing protein, partial [Candidatus Dorea gallistercoris]|nr:SpoIID/LytB domain-containing protein [Candidatus Dorea gallistercoris]
EMPASYELEALKAQAVCARSYAYRQMESYGYPEYEAHVNDSTAYQVYGNSAPADSTREAVEATAGETVRYQGKVVTTYYYSTSCGRTTNVEAWGTTPSEANGYLQSVEVCGAHGDYEKDLPWYRWKATVSAETLSNLIGLNTGTDIGTASEIKVTKRGPGEVALAIQAVGSKGSVTVETENKIRRALGGEGYEIEKQDGSVAASAELLPSAFFTIERSGDTFVIQGGGYGHGIGMSQNGANEMAKQGMDYREILCLFYQNVTIE